MDKGNEAVQLMILSRKVMRWSLMIVLTGQNEREELEKVCKNNPQKSHCRLIHTTVLLVESEQQYIPPSALGRGRTVLLEQGTWATPRGSLVQPTLTAQKLTRLCCSLLRDLRHLHLHKLEGAFADFDLQFSNNFAKEYIKAAAKKT